VSRYRLISMCRVSRFVFLHEECCLVASRRARVMALPPRKRTSPINHMPATYAPPDPASRTLKLTLYKFNESKNPQHSPHNPRPRRVYSGMQHAILAAISRGACLGLGFSRESTTPIVFGMLEAPVWASEVSFRDSNAAIGQ
jgi:hypothetical protein